jgi:hypothetical protein
MIAKDMFEEGKNFIKDLFVQSRQREYDDFCASESEKKLVTSQLRTEQERLATKEQNLTFLREKLLTYKNADFAVSIFSFVNANGASPASLSKAAEALSGPYMLSQCADAILKIAEDDLAAHRESIQQFKKTNARVLKELGLI